MEESTTPELDSQAGGNIESPEKPHGNHPHRMRQQMSQRNKQKSHMEGKVKIP